MYMKYVTKFSPDYFLHLAARTDLKENSDINGYSANIDGVKNTIGVLNFCNNLKRIIFTSSRMVCKIGYQPKDEFDYCPPNLYGESKVIGEKLVRKVKINPEWVIIRPTSIWGPWFDVPYKDFFTSIKMKVYFNPGNFNPKKSFGFVVNTVYQIDQLLHADQEVVDKKTFYICDYPPIKLKEWAELIRIAMKLRPIQTLPYTFLKIIAKLGDVFAGVGWYKFPLTTFRLNNLITNMTYDTQALENICGMLPYCLAEGVMQTVEWMKANKNYENSN